MEHTLKLGKNLPKRDPRTLRLSFYAASVLPPAPPVYDGIKGWTGWGMMANDRVGDCTIAMVGHIDQGVQLVAGCPSIVSASDADILRYYSLWDGYNPADSSTDQGGNLLDVLKQWKAQGFNGKTISGFASADTGNIEQLKSIISTLGPAAVGLGLPATAEDQIGMLWDVVGNPSVDLRSRPYSWGGHAIGVVSYNAVGPICITWGKPQQMTWKFWQTYVDESYAVLLDELFQNQVSPSGYDLKTLLADISGIV